MEGLTTTQRLQFFRGDETFGETFTAATGLGPIFVANQCASCHPGDGKGHPFVRFTSFGQSDSSENQFLSSVGPPLQQKAIHGFQPEVLPVSATSKDLVAPVVTGLGFLDAVTDAYLIALSDPNNIDGDGISGHPHYTNIPSDVSLRTNTVSSNGKYLTRFGKKGAVYDLLHQKYGAYNQDMVITSTFEPVDPATQLEVDPELSTQTVNDVVAGQQLFSQIECSGCHAPTTETGFSTIAALSNKTFSPYTNLLLHDMGPGLDDQYTEGRALTSEWKTPALWGLGLSFEAQGGMVFLLHDGRATTIAQAITLHGGEAERSKNKYNQLSETEKQELITFLRSL